MRYETIENKKLSVLEADKFQETGASWLSSLEGNADYKELLHFSKMLFIRYGESGHLGDFNSSEVLINVTGRVNNVFWEIVFPHKQTYKYLKIKPIKEGLLNG